MLRVSNRHKLRQGILPTLFALAVVGTPHTSAASLPPSQPKAELQSRIESMLNQVKGASWTQSIWLTNGKAEEENKADCLWAGPARLRLDVHEGKGAGFRIELEEEKVTVYKRGLFSFARFRYHVTDDTVRSLRGHDLRSTGFFQELEEAVKQWDEVTVDPGFGGMLTLQFQRRDGLMAHLELDEQTLTVSSMKLFDGGELVERHRYENVKYMEAAPFD